MGVSEFVVHLLYFLICDFYLLVRSLELFQIGNYILSHVVEVEYQFPEFFHVHFHIAFGYEENLLLFETFHRIQDSLKVFLYILGDFLRHRIRPRHDPEEYQKERYSNRQNGGNVGWEISLKNQDHGLGERIGIVRKGYEIEEGESHEFPFGGFFTLLYNFLGFFSVFIGKLWENLPHRFKVVAVKAY